MAAVIPGPPFVIVCAIADQVRWKTAGLETRVKQIIRIAKHVKNATRQELCQGSMFYSSLEVEKTRLEI
jgi:hypothetical protein